jgi:outer membrane lipoprotein-sorting protein
MPRLSRRILRGAILALILFSAGAAFAERAAPKPPPDPEAPGLALPERSSALINRIQIEQKALESLEADFVQLRESEFLTQAEESRGRFAYRAPDRVRWDYVTPKPVALVLDDKEMLTWYQDLGKAERVKVGRVSSQVFRYLNASGSLENLMKYFAVTITFSKVPGEPYRLELQPRYARIKKRLSGMTIWIDRKLFLPVKVRYVESNGDTTEYRFESLRRNEPIPDGRFELALPPGVEVKEVDLDRDRSGDAP